GSEGVLTGTARAAQEAKETAAALLNQQDIERKQRNLERRNRALEAKIAGLRAEFEAEKEELEKEIIEQKQREGVLERDRAVMAKSRKADASSSNHLRSQRSKNASVEIN
ncbi:MAG TPA: KaiC 1, partial [Candidatus Binatia bacterium]|nr:KaiC 1 [Candidatus Binatia bacterium]